MDEFKIDNHGETLLFNSEGQIEFEGSEQYEIFQLETEEAKKLVIILTGFIWRKDDV